MKTTALVLSSLLLAATGVTACVDGTDDNEDGIDDVGVPDGKADGAFSECEKNAVVALINGGVTRADLEANGVGSRAATGLVAKRDGADKKFGTRDDKPFADIAAVDAVSYVGPKALQALVAMVGNQCSSSATLREGFHQLRPFDSRSVYSGIAVNGTTAYLASNDRTIDVINLKTMTKSKTFTRIAAEHLAFDNGKLVACGLRNDAPLGFPPPPTNGMSNNYVIAFIDPSTGRVDQEVILKLEEYLLTSTNDAFIDLPNMSCDVSNGRISVSFAQRKLQHEIVSFAVPSTNKIYDFRSITGATRISVGALGRNRTISGFSYSSQRGYTLAAGGYGIDRLDTQTAPVRELRAAAQREWWVDIVDNGGATMLAVDLDGLVLKLDAKTGATLATAEVPDWLEDITVSNGYALVAARHGIFVQKQ